MTPLRGAPQDTADAAALWTRAWTSYAYQAWRGAAVDPPDGDPPALALRQLGFAGLVFRALRDAEDPRAGEFRHDYQHALTANLIRLTHADAFCRALELSGITAVLIKGAAFLARFPDDLGIRAMSDVDVLVRAADFARSRQALLEAGYRMHQDVGVRVGRSAPSLDFVKDVGPTEVEIDLHRGIAQAPLLPNLPADIAAHQVRLGSRRVPAPPEAFCVAAAHRARHGFASWGLDLLDLRYLASASDATGWEAIVQSAVRHGVAGAAYVGLRQAAWWLGGEPADEARQRQLGDVLARPVRALLDRMGDPRSLLEARTVWSRPLVRTLVVYPATIGPVWRVVAAAATHVPRRTVDDWTGTRGAPLSARTGQMLRIAALRSAGRGGAAHTRTLSTKGVREA